MGCQKYFTKIQKNKKHTIKNKIDENQKTNWNNELFWVQRLYAEFQTRKSENGK